MDGGSPTLRGRISAATRLGDAIADCDPRDAVLIMGAALDDLTGETPSPAFIDAEHEAAFWAELATPIELEACFTASIERLQQSAHTTNAKKRLFVALWKSFGATDRAAFLDRFGSQAGCDDGQLQPIQSQIAAA